MGTLTFISGLGYFYEVLKSVSAELEPNRLSPFPIVIGIGGGTASGKTTVVNEILSRFRAPEVNMIPHDSYYRDRSHLPVEERATLNYDHPDALETSLLVEHLRRLRAGKQVEVPLYDFVTHTRRSERRSIVPCKVLIVEGFLVLSDPGLRELVDIKVFVDADADLRFIRRMERDISERARTRESVVRQYLEFVRPAHLEYVEPSRRQADVILPMGKDNRVAVDLLVSLIEDILIKSRA